MLSHRFLFLTGSLLLLLSCFSATAQTTPKTGAFTDEPTDNGASHVLHFAATGAAPNKQVILNVMVREADDREPVMGATVLLRREKPVRMYGKVTGPYGTCALTIAPDTYAVRVQVTGLASFEQSGFVLEPGTTYTLEIGLAFTKK